MGVLAKSTYLSPEEYLLRENGRPDDIKHEYINQPGLCHGGSQPRA
jgi:hypothetical protein